MPRDALSDLPARVRWARETAGLSARALSLLAGLTKSHVGQIEEGRYPSVGVTTLVKLGTVFAVSLDWLVAGRGRRPTKAEIIAAVRRAQRPVRKSPRRARRSPDESGEHPAVSAAAATGTS